MKPTSRTSSPMIVLLLGSPLLLWLGLSAPRDRASAKITVADAATVATYPSTPTSSVPIAPQTENVPSSYCVSRVLEPLQQLAAALPVAAQDEHGVAGTDADWLARVDQSARRLRDALRATGSGPDAVIETLIVTIPDPVDSGLVYQFETALQALHSGLEYPLAKLGAAYFRDRGFLPWDDRERPPSQRAESEACRSALPGILLFRNSALEQPRIVAVLLVGETPTTGLHGAAMSNALRMARALDGGATPGHRRSMRIVGPTFSGSAYSLRLALRNDATTADEPVDYQIISGTARGPGVPGLLDGHGLQIAPGSQLHFATTTVSEADTECAYLWFLHNRLGVGLEQVGSRATLSEVATLHESGTEFGARDAANGGACPLEAGVSLSFPVHVSILRDAYEKLSRPGETSIARATSLTASLRDPRAALDVEASSSDKTRAALDIMLSSVLAEISRRGIRHVSIHATDIGDAIFLARKIRDVAPDVRLAFFEPHAILLHPDYQSDLLGSLVISPYAFLGVSEFRHIAPTRPEYRGFPNGSAEGMFNAVLAQRGAAPNELVEYTIAENPTLLPIWISTIARTGLVASDVRPPADRTATIYGSARRNAARSSPQDEPWYDALRQAHLPIDHSLQLPRLWTFLYMALVFGFVVDQGRQTRRARLLAVEDMPETMLNSDDQPADRAIGRTKWWFYASIRTFLFVLAFCHMGAVYALAFIARDGVHTRSVIDLLSTLIAATFVVTVIAVSSSRCYHAVRNFTRDYRAFARYVGGHVFPLSWRDVRAGFQSGRISSIESAAAQSETQSAAMRWSLSLGLAPPVGRVEAARISFAQLRLSALFAASMTLYFTACVCLDGLSSCDGRYMQGLTAVPALTLTVLRNVPLMNGISPAAPALLCIGCIYVWVVGRMSRIALAHGISRIAPADGESDLVSTPIRLLLYPRYSVDSHYDEGYTRCERDLLNSIWRPMTGRYYVFALFAVVFFPLILFSLKPLSTLEAFWGTALLGGGLALCATLIGVTVIQLVQYWLCLERLLKRTMAHRLGPAFRDLPRFARESLDRLISRSPNELLAWVACARQLGDLAGGLDSVSRWRAAPDCRSWLPTEVKKQRVLCQAAMTMADAPDGTGCEEVELAECIITSASRLTMLLEDAWEMPAREVTQVVVEVTSARQLAVGDNSAVANDQVLRRATSIVAEEQPSSVSTREASSVHAAATEDALHAIEHHFDADELSWLRHAQVFVATVAALLIHRHVRQFRYFVTTLTGAVLLLLLAVTSYPFEPFRLLLTCIWVMVATVAAGSMWIYLQLDRNTLLSLMSGTPPNQVTWNGALWLRIIAWAAVPLLSVAAAQYPDLANLLFRVVAPFANALR